MFTPYFLCSYVVLCVSHTIITWVLPLLLNKMKKAYTPPEAPAFTVPINGFYYHRVARKSSQCHPIQSHIWIFSSVRSYNLRPSVHSVQTRLELSFHHSGWGLSSTIGAQQARSLAVRSSSSAKVLLSTLQILLDTIQERTVSGLYRLKSDKAGPRQCMWQLCCVVQAVNMRAVDSLFCQCMRCQTECLMLQWLHFVFWAGGKWKHSSQCVTETVSTAVRTQGIPVDRRPPNQQHLYNLITSALPVYWTGALPVH